MSDFMSKIHVWIGCTKQSINEFIKYFKIDEKDKEKYFSIEEQEAKALGYGASQFDKDLGTGWYDDDLIGVFYNTESNVLEVALEELPFGEKKVKVACFKKGITEANAMFYYTDSELEVKNDKKIYNDLMYLGCFDE